MLNHLRQLKADEKPFTVDVHFLTGKTLQRVKVEEADNLGLLILSRGHLCAIPWTAVRQLTINEETENGA